MLLQKKTLISIIDLWLSPGNAIQKITHINFDKQMWNV